MINVCIECCYYLPFKEIKDSVVADDEFGRVIFAAWDIVGCSQLRGTWNSIKQKYKDLTTQTTERTRRQILPHIVLVVREKLSVRRKLPGLVQGLVS